MASSDLTLQALMAGGVPQNQDPALLGIMPKMKLAQAMLEEGTSTAPVASSKYGGLGKIAQALLGSYAMGSAQNDVADLMKQRQQGFTDFMGQVNDARGVKPSTGGIIQGGTPTPPAAAAAPSAVPAVAPSPAIGEASNAGYGTKLAAQLGIGPDDKLDMTDPTVRARLVSAISNNEGSGPGVRSTRNNNPGNLEASAWTQKQPGYVGTDGRFAQFETPEHGIAAAHALLQNYGAQGLNTPNAIAAKWAPVPVQADGGVASVAAPTAPGQGAPPAVDPMATINRLQQLQMAATASFDPRIQAQAANIQHAIDMEKFRLENTFHPNAAGSVNSLGKQNWAPIYRPFAGPGGAMYLAGPNGQNTLAVSSDPAADAARAGAIAKAEAVARLPSQIALSQLEPRTISPGQDLTSGLARGLPGNGDSVLSGGSGGNAPQPSPHPPGSYVPGAVTDMYKYQHEKDVANVQADIDKAKAGNKIYGTTATIRATLPEVTTGILADPKLYAGQWASALGMSPENVLKYTGTKPVEGEILQKKLFELQTGAARELGAREPGSVIAMYRENYPNMKSQNMTINAMTRLLDMDQRHQSDYANAKAKALDAARADYQTNGQHYNGLTDFDSKFHETNNPIVYTAAALLAAKMPHATWANGLSPDQQEQAVQLATTHWNDVKGFMHPSGQFYVPKRQQ